MKRRRFLALLGTAALGPVAARAQPTVPTIGLLNGQTQTAFHGPLDAFRKGVGEIGYVENQNVNIETRWADGRLDRLPGLVEDLLRRQVAVIVATAGSFAAARAKVGTMPIVATFGGDPVRQGIVASLNRPGGNVTGVSIITSALEAKRFELMHELLPNASLLGVLLDENFSDTAGQRRQVEETARSTGQQIRAISVRRESEFEAVFASLVESKAAGLVVTGSPFMNSSRAQIVALAARHRLPAIYETREAVVEGGLMSYGTNIARVYQQLGNYAGRILQGAKPADLPVVQPSKLDIAINLKTAKTLGLDIPTSILLRADEVIE